MGRTRGRRTRRGRTRRRRTRCGPLHVFNLRFSLDDTVFVVNLRPRALRNCPAVTELVQIPKPRPPHVHPASEPPPCSAPPPAPPWRTEDTWSKEDKLQRGRGACTWEPEGSPPSSGLPGQPPACQPVTPCLSHSSVKTVALTVCRSSPATPGLRLMLRATENSTRDENNAGPDLGWDSVTSASAATTPWAAVPLPGPRAPPRGGVLRQPPICRGCHSGCGDQAKGVMGHRQSCCPRFP